MPKPISVYLDETAFTKLTDIQRVLEHDIHAPLSLTKTVIYAIVSCWSELFQHDDITEAHE